MRQTLTLLLGTAAASEFGPGLSGMLDRQVDEFGHRSDFIDRQAISSLSTPSAEVHAIVEEKIENDKIKKSVKKIFTKLHPKSSLNFSESPKILNFNNELGSETVFPWRE